MANHQRTVTLIGKVVISAIFLVAGITKLQDPEAFASSIASFKLLPAALIPLVATTIPTLEILIAIGIFIPAIEGGSTALLTWLCFGFTIFYATTWARGITPDCGCFGSISALSANSPEGFFRGLLLTALSAALWAKRLRK